MAVRKIRGKWWIDFYYLGIRHREVVGTKRKDAEAALNQIRVMITAGTYVPIEERELVEPSSPEQITFSAFSKEEFLPWSQMEHSAKHYTRLESIVRVHLVPYFDRRLLSEITTKLIEDYKGQRRRSYSCRGRKRQRVSAATVNRELCCVKVVLRKATEWGRLETSPARDVRAFKETNKEPRLIEQEEVARLLQELPDHLRGLIACVVNAGLRRAELFFLRWEDIDWKRAELTVASREEHHTKNYESRRIPMNDALCEELRLHKRDHIIVGSPYVFANRNRHGKPYTDIREPLRAAAKRAGIQDDIGLHQLRHAFCSHALMSGIDPRTVQKWMGHKDLKTTLRYAHVSPDHEREAIQKLSYQTEQPEDAAGLVAAGL
jgi:integrase